MDREVALKYGTGEARATAAEAWFTFLGFVAATAVLHAAADKSGAVALVILKWLSYAMLFGWVNYKVDQLIWAHFPAVDPRINKPTAKQIAISVWVSSMIVFGAYLLVIHVINALIKENAV